MAKKRAITSVEKRGRYHHGNLREALLQAAARRIAESRDFDFRLRDLAEDCGVQLAACYRHFAAKSDVLVEIARRGFVLLGEALSGLAADDDPVRALAELGARYIVFAHDQPVAYLAMFHPALARRGTDPELDAAAGATLEVLRVAVAHALGRKSEARRVEQDRAVFQAWAGVHGYASLLVSRHHDSPLLDQGASRKAIATYSEMLARGVLARDR